MIRKQVLFRFIFAGAVLASGWLASGLMGPSVFAQEKQDPPSEKKGIVMGVLVAKGKGFIEVKAFGEEKARKYVPHWVGGLPAQGGGPDKKMLAVFEKLKVGQKVRLTWEFEERLRAVQVEVLDKKDPPETDKK